VTYKKHFLSLVFSEEALDKPYSLFMTKVDINFGGYSEYVFYKMQLLYESNVRVYILFTRWGRIGSEGQY